MNPNTPNPVRFLSSNDIFACSAADVATNTVRGVSGAARAMSSES